MSYPEPPQGPPGSGAFPPAPPGAGYPPADHGTYPPVDRGTSPPEGPGFPPPGPPPSGGGGGRGAIIAVVVVVVVALAAIGGFLLLGSDDDDDSSGGSDTATGSGDDVSVLDLKVGDCWNDIPDDGVETDTVSTVPCTEPHEGEVYAVSAMELGDDWPGQDQVSTEAEAECVQQFEGFVGMAYQDSALSIFYFSPTEDSWAAGDRGAVCVVVDPTTPDGKTTGTLQGAAR